MKDFPLIRSLQDKSDKTPLPKGHKYAEYEVTVEGETMTVNIPVNETEAFESALEETDLMDKYSFNRIMREVRGIRG